MSLSARDHLCFPLDYPDLGTALRGAEAVAEWVGVFKVGLELFIASGPEGVRALQKMGRRIFLDLKLHDIPKTVEGAVLRAADLEVDYLTLHAAGGSRMMEPAVGALDKLGSPLKLLGVTVLTSLSDADLREVGLDATTSSQALSLAKLATRSGVRGLVCSTQELEPFRAELGSAVELVTPGIRPSGAAAQDQHRMGTPGSAIAAGSNLLVVGRPIRDAPDPAAAAEAICSEISAHRR